MTIIVLCCVATMLLLACAISIIRPVRFGNEMAKRDKAVMKAALVIGTAQERYLQKNGSFAASFDMLLADSCIADPQADVIPFSDGEKFTIRASAKKTKTGKVVPLMEVSARYDQYLKGLGENNILEQNRMAAEQGRFPGVIIGHFDKQ